MLAHIKAGQVISEYNEGKGRVTFENGSTVSPPAAGVYGDEQYGFEQLVPIVVVTVDNSTTTHTTSARVDTVETDRVLRTVTISDVPIEDIRAGKSCSKMQGVLTLGEANWSKVMKFYTTDATWVQRAVIDSAGEWQRSSQNIAFFGYLLNFDDEEMDTMFDAAKLLET
jgi:hypothetical protein